MGSQLRFGKFYIYMIRVLVLYLNFKTFSPIPQFLSATSLRKLGMLQLDLVGNLSLSLPLMVALQIPMDRTLTNLNSATKTSEMLFTSK